MKLTVQRVMDVLPFITAIINDGRKLPQKGAYRLARMYAKLLPEFEVANKQRNALIRAYDFPLMVSPRASAEDPLGQGPKVPSGEFTVPLDKLEEFNAAWKEIGEQEIEVDIQPAPLEQFDLGPNFPASIEAHELAVLGELVEG